MNKVVKSKESKRSSSLVSTLLVIFIILKLTNVIDWKWIWVLSPLWIGVSLAIIIFAIVGIAFIFGITRITKIFEWQNE